MNIELICWILAFFVVWEIAYLIILKYHDSDWVGAKIKSCFLIVTFFLAQFAVVVNYSSSVELNNPFPLCYERLIWEFFIVVGIVMFFYLNKQLAKWIQK